MNLEMHHLFTWCQNKLTEVKKPNYNLRLVITYVLSSLDSPLYAVSPSTFRKLTKTKPAKKHANHKIK